MQKSLKHIWHSGSAMEERWRNRDYPQIEPQRDENHTERPSRITPQHLPLVHGISVFFARMSMVTLEPDTVVKTPTISPFRQWHLRRRLHTGREFIVFMGALTSFASTRFLDYPTSCRNTSRTLIQRRPRMECSMQNVYKMSSRNSDSHLYPLTNDRQLLNGTRRVLLINKVLLHMGVKLTSPPGSATLACSKKNRWSCRSSAGGGEKSGMPSVLFQELSGVELALARS